MHICHLTLNSIELERRILNQIQSACSHNYQVTVFSHGKRGEKKTEYRTDYTLRRLFTYPAQKGVFKFLIFNLKLSFFLFRHSWTIVHCHDLWPLPAAALLSLVKRYKLVYDAHEYYSGLEIFVSRPVRKALWMLAERLFVYRSDVLFTVSDQLGELYRTKYPRLKRVEIIRNLPAYEAIDQTEKSEFPHHLVFQGHFKPGRGLELLFEALTETQNIHLTLIGGGELQTQLEKQREKYRLQNRIHFKPYVPLQELLKLTARYDAGVVLFQPTSQNYAYALPNKFFEYLMAGLPVLASNIDTLKAYVSHYDVGVTVDPMNVNSVISGLKDLFADKARLDRWHINARNAAHELNWEKESIKLLHIYEEIVA